MGLIWRAFRAAGRANLQQDLERERLGLRPVPWHTPGFQVEPPPVELWATSNWAPTHEQDTDNDQDY